MRETVAVAGVTKYATTTDGVHIAYQVLGDGPTDLVFVPGFVFNVEAAWNTMDRVASFLRRLAEFSRLLIFDRRGTGLSDRVMASASQLTLEARMDDVRAVMDAAGFTRASLLTFEETLALGVLFATTYPDRTAALVSYSGIASGRWRPDYPWAPSDEEWESDLTDIRSGWGGPLAAAWAEDIWPGLDEPSFIAQYATWMRWSVSPGDAAVFFEVDSMIDVRDLLPSVRVPSLVLHRVGDRINPIEAGRHIAGLIPGSTLVELPGSDHGWMGPSQDELIDEIRRFLDEMRAEDAALDRVLATVVFIDIVSSTALLEQAGDSAWRESLASHRRLMRGLLARYRGREVVTTGDGFLAVFDGPARAVKFAETGIVGTSDMGLGMRAGIHTGEIQLMGDDVTGVAVHIAARIASIAEPSEVLVSRTVRDLVFGAGLTFSDRGEHGLKGIGSSWHLFALDKT